MNNSAKHTAFFCAIARCATKQEFSNATNGFSDRFANTLDYFPKSFANTSYSFPDSGTDFCETVCK